MLDWREFHEQYGPLVWGTVYRILANHADALDCCQDVFTEVLEQTSPEGVRDWPAFLRWLATRRALNRLRKLRTDSRRVAGGNVSYLAAAAPAPDAETEWNELLERVRQEMTRLPPDQAEAFWLRCVEQLTYAEIGTQLKVDSNTVGVLVYRARQRLQQLLADLNPVHRSF